MSGGQREEDGWEGTPGSECGGLAGVGLSFLLMLLLIRERKHRINTFYGQDSSCFLGKTVFSSFA